jgi:hypothetical protein
MMLHHVYILWLFIKVNVAIICTEHWEGVGNAYKVLVEKPEGKRPLGRNSHGEENNIKFGFKV